MMVRELMSGGVITVGRRTPVVEARDLMARERIRHLPVTDGGGAVLGIITDRDIRLSLPSQATTLSVWELNYLLTKLTVDEVMNKPVITIGPDRPAREAARLMLDHKIGALPVLDESHLIGIITETDIVRAFVHLTAPMPLGRY